MADDRLGDFHISEFIGKVNGGDHLNAEHRMTWFHETYGDRGSLVTEMLHHTTFAEAGPAACAVFKASVTIYDENNFPFVYTGHGSETHGDFGDYIMKAETKAISRALAHAGFGTMNAQVKAGALAPHRGPARSVPRATGNQPARDVRPTDADQARNKALFERRRAEATEADRRPQPAPDRA